MGFAGQTYQIPCDKGGFSFDKNLDTIDPSMFVLPSKNINLHQNGREKRGGTSKVNASAVSGTPRILGIIDFRLSGSAYQVFAGDDGKIYRDSTTVLKTGMSTTNKYSFAVFGAELYICDGASIPQTWNGAAAGTSNITTEAADWSSTKPIQMIAHSRGASRRMWAIAGNALYYSSLGNGQVFSGGTSGKLSIDVQDTSGLVGMIEFGENLIAFSRSEAFIVTDQDIDVATWGYIKAPWNGGAANWRTMVKIENDVAILSEDGQLYSITGVQDFGDYKAASLMRPSYIDNYFKENADLTKIDDFHLVFDRNLRAIKLFFVRENQTRVDSALVYFIDRGPAQGWVIHDNAIAAGYSASCSTEVRTSTGNYLVYTGDYVGTIWKLEQEARHDNGSAFYGGFKTPNLNFTNSRLRKHYRQLRCVVETTGTTILQVRIWVDGTYKESKTINIGSSPAGVLGTFVLNLDVLGGSVFTDGQSDLNHIGKRIQLEVFNTGFDQKFFISQLMFDFKQLPTTI